MSAARGGVRWSVAGLIVAGGLLGGAAEAAGEEFYSAIQSAFLSERFARVVELSAPLLRGPQPLPSVGDLTKPARIWLWHILSLERLQRGPEALQEIDRLKHALGMLPRDTPAQQAMVAGLWAEALFWEGEISRKSLNLVRAKLAYERVVTQHESSSWRPRAQMGLGLVLFQHQDYQEAAEHFRRVAFGAPSSSLAGEARLLEGLCQLRMKRFNEALVLFKLLLEQTGERHAQAQVLFYLGEGYTGLRRFEEGVEVYQQAIAADPESRWAALSEFGLGWTRFQQHRCAESLEAMTRYLRAAPSIAADPAQRGAESPVEALFAVGRCEAELGEEANALSRLAELRALEPEHPLAVEAAFSMAEIYERQHRFNDASALLREILREGFDAAHLQQANLRLGSVLLAQGEAQAAIEHFQAARDAADSGLRQSAVNGIADSHAKLGHRKEAAGYYDESIGLGAATQAGLYALYGLGRLHLQGGELPEAIDTFRKLTAGGMDLSMPMTDERRALLAEGRLALAFAYLSNGQPDLARIQLQRIETELPGSAQAIRGSYYLALLAVDDGELTAARRLCERVVAGAPRSQEALESRLLLVDLIAGQSSLADAIAVAGRDVASLPAEQRGRLAQRLGEVAARSGEHAEAIRWLELAWDDLPAQRAHLEYLVASSLEAGGDVAAALWRYQAITAFPWSVRGRLSAAKLLEREGRLQEAIAVYSAIAKEDVPEAKVARERLQALRTASAESARAHAGGRRDASRIR